MDLVSSNFDISRYSLKKLGFCDSNTGPKMKFDKIHSKKTIITWPDMPSFRYFGTFEFVSSLLEALKLNCQAQ